MSSCKRATEARVRPKPKDSAATMNNLINSHPSKMCSCGKMCKNNRGLKIYRKSQMSNTRKQVGSSSPKMLCVSAECYFVIMPHFDEISITEHLTTTLLLSQIVRSQLLATSVMHKQKTSLSIL